VGAKPRRCWIMGVGASKIVTRLLVDAESGKIFRCLVGAKAIQSLVAESYYTGPRMKGRKWVRVFDDSLSEESRKDS